MRTLYIAVLLALLLVPSLPIVALARIWSFTDVTAAAGINLQHGYVGGNTSMPRIISGGVAVGDYDADGWDDLYIVSGDIGDNRLYRNRGDGTFEDLAGFAGVRLVGSLSVGPSFFDYDGDGLLDLFVGGIEGSGPFLFHNEGGGVFLDVTVSSGLTSAADTWSVAAGDYDKDGDLDLFLAHWSQSSGAEHLWRNNGDGTFTAVDAEAGITGITDTGYDFSFTPNFADLDNDGWLDIALTSDFGTSQVFHNNGNGTFSNITPAVLTDENGMGAALADYDNDGDLDWFISSIYEADGDPDGGWGVSGNRLYRNRGDGTFEDATDIAGVRAGHWGWGSVFADLNNDGYEDLFHVNGWEHVLFQNDPARLFVNNGNGTFTEEAALHGIADLGQGRGVACFDYDHDGDLDLLISNNGQAARLYRNDGGNRNNWLSLRLRMSGLNRQALGARVYVTVNGMTQMREIHCGSNFASQNPAGAHFGLMAATQADVRIDWPDGSSDLLTGVAANQRLLLDQDQLRSVGLVPAMRRWACVVLLLLLFALRHRALSRRRLI